MNDIEKIKEIRRSIVKMVHNAGVSHIGAAFSMIEILYSLYFKVMKHDPKNPEDPDRDIFVLSKGHGSAGLYATLAHSGYFPEEDLMTYCVNDGKLPGHLDKDSCPGVEVSAGSLGHGFPISLGLALARKNTKQRVFCIIGDGECNEGSIWEAAMLAPSLGLNNFTVIIDFNKIQSFGKTNEIIDQTNMAERWASFGWDTVEIDGHNIEEIENALQANGSAFQKITDARLARSPEGAGPKLAEANEDEHNTADGASGMCSKPKAIVAHTVKGRGVSFMEDQLLWHYKSPDGEQLAQALEELK
ncbi:MAG: transketolase [Candidatus Melainabacteria bacterium]|jgi:transketolase|nr:transketolase [Candidatus Melainabacteria bacterium]